MERLVTDATTAARIISKRVGEMLHEQRMQGWKSKPKAGGVANESHIDQELSYLWINRGWLSKVNMRNAIATQEQCLFTRTLAGKGDIMCRRCYKAPETTQHVVVGCEQYRTSNIENLIDLPYPRGTNLKACLNEMYAAEYKSGTRVVPIIIDCCGEVMPQIKEKIESLGISEYRKVLEKFQRAAVQGTGRLVRAYLSLD